MSNSLSDLVSIGELIKPHGIKGEIKILLFNEESKSLKNNQIVFLKNSRDNFFKYKIENVIYSMKKNRIKFFEIDSIDSADKLRGYILSIPRSDFPELENEEYYLNDLIGYTLLDKTNNNYGCVDDIFHFPANDVLSVSLNDKEYLIPIIDDIILDIDHDSRLIIINPISGLFD